MAESDNSLEDNLLILEKRIRESHTKTDVKDVEVTVIRNASAEIDIDRELPIQVKTINSVSGWKALVRIN